MLFFLNQCGFQPMFGPENEELYEDFSAIKIDPIRNRSGQIMRNELKKAFYVKGQAHPSKYVLTVTIKTSDEDLTYLSDQTAGRKAITASISYTLKEKESGKRLTSGSLSKTAEYNVSSANSFGTIVSAERVKQDAITGGARDLKVRLAEYFIKQKTVPAQTA